MLQRVFLCSFTILFFSQYYIILLLPDYCIVLFHYFSLLWRFPFLSFWFKFVFFFFLLFLSDFTYHFLLRFLHLIGWGSFGPSLPSKFRRAIIVRNGKRLICTRTLPNLSLHWFRGLRKSKERCCVLRYPFFSQSDLACFWARIFWLSKKNFLYYSLHIFYFFSHLFPSFFFSSSIPFWIFSSFVFPLLYIFLFIYPPALLRAWRLIEPITSITVSSTFSFSLILFFDPSCHLFFSFLPSSLFSFYPFALSLYLSITLFTIIQWFYEKLK